MKKDYCFYATKYWGGLYAEKQITKQEIPLPVTPNQTNWEWWPLRQAMPETHSNSTAGMPVGATAANNATTRLRHYPTPRSPVARDTS